MPVCIIDRFEEVDVDDQDGERIAVLVVMCQRLVELPPIGEIRQSVGQRQFLLRLDELEMLP